MHGDTYNSNAHGVRRGHRRRRDRPVGRGLLRGPQRARLTARRGCRAAHEAGSETPAGAGSAGCSSCGSRRPAADATTAKATRSSRPARSSTFATLNLRANGILIQPPQEGCSCLGRAHRRRHRSHARGRGRRHAPSGGALPRRRRRPEGRTSDRCTSVEPIALEGADLARGRLLTGRGSEPPYQRGAADGTAVKGDAARRHPPQPRPS